MVGFEGVEGTHRRTIFDEACLGDAADLPRFHDKM